MAIATATHIMPLAAAEPYGTAVLLLIFGALVAISVLFSRTVDRLGIPIVLLFLILGMLGGSEGVGGVEFDNYAFAVRVGTAALVLILFDGGLNTSVGSIRQVLYPSLILATAGVAMTAGLVAVCARMLGLPWLQALLLGSIVSSTDAAAVFAVLRGGRLSLRPRLGRTLEVESCINDPMAVILTVGMMQIILAGEAPGWRTILDVPLQLVIGAGVGIALGFAARQVLRNVHLTTVGLYPALTLAIAFISFGAATVVNGSGFMAVYATAVVLGASESLPYRSGMTRVHDALAWLSQIGMFLMLGLLAFPSRLWPIAGTGLALGLFLSIIARPLAVLPCVLPFKFSWTEIGYLGWNGLRGAVPIILGTFPVLAQVPGAERIFDLVFFIVVVSSVVPGMTIRFVTRRLKLDVPEQPTPPAILEINSSHRLKGRLSSFFIEPSVAVCGVALREIEFPPNAAVVMIVRDDDLIVARGSTVIEPNDHVYLFHRPEDRPFIELLFGRPEEGGTG